LFITALMLKITYICIFISLFGILFGSIILLLAYCLLLHVPLCIVQSDVKPLVTCQTSWLKSIGGCGAQQKSSR